MSESLGQTPRVTYRYLSGLRAGKLFIRRIIVCLGIESSFTRAPIRYVHSDYIELSLLEVNQLVLEGMFLPIQKLQVQSISN
jgi:hypothetical protein